MSGEEIELRPSEIFYSQCSIHVALCGGSWLGQVLDDLIDGELSVRDLGLINVVKIPGDNKLYSLDNRRLWLFHHLEGAGKCSKIPVKMCKYEPGHDHKFTSRNGGVSIRIREDRDITGVYGKYRPTPVTPR